ncbi:MAG: hypothetical protein VW397_06165 [Candidatus Margulisiibacteriota bacterium]
MKIIKIKRIKNNLLPAQAYHHDAKPLISASPIIHADNVFQERFNCARILAKQLTQFSQMSDYPPSDSEVKLIVQFLALFWDKNHIDHIEENVIISLNLLRFPNELLIKHTHINDEFTQSIALTWTKLKTLVGVTYKAMDPASIEQDFFNFTQSLLVFKTSLIKWSQSNIDALNDLWIRLETERRVRKNHPDPVYCYIETGLVEFQMNIEKLIQTFNQDGCDQSLDIAIQKLNDRWPLLSWLELPSVERHRELWLSFVKTNQITIPSLDWELVEFQLFNIPYNPNSPPPLDILTDTFLSIIEFIESEIEDHTIQEIRLQCIDGPIIESIDKLYEHVTKMIDILCQQMGRYAQKINYESALHHMTETCNKKGVPSALPIAFKFLLFYGRLFYKQNLTSILDTNPNLLEMKTVKLERNFFLERPIPKTHEWIQNHLKKGTDSRRFFPTFGRYLILNELLSKVLHDGPIKKIDLPEILRWDTSRLIDIQQICLLSIQKRVIYQTSQQLFKKFFTNSLPEQWLKQLPTDYTIPDILDWIWEKTHLCNASKKQFKALLKTNLSPDSPMYQALLNETKQQLHNKIMNPSTRFEYHALFPIHDLYMILNYLTLVHQPLFNYAHDRFMKSEILKQLTYEHPIIETPPFKSIAPMIKKAQDWLQKMSIAMATMRQARQYAIKKYPYLSKSTDIFNSISSINARLSPLFQGFFSFQGIAQLNDTDFLNHLNQLSCQYVHDICEAFQQQFAMIIYQEMNKVTLPKKSAKNTTLHSIWEVLLECHQTFQDLSDQDQAQTCQTLFETGALPQSIPEFKKLNHYLKPRITHPFSFKISSNKFTDPIQTCFKELLLLVESIISGDLIQHDYCPIDPHGLYRMKNFFQALKLKLNHDLEHPPEVKKIQSVSN